MKTIKLICAIVSIAMLTGITSCSTNPVDKAMDAYEKVLTKWEKDLDGQRLSFDRMNEFKADLEATGLKEEDFKNLKPTDLSKEQQERAMKIAQRMQKLMMY